MASSRPTASSIPLVVVGNQRTIGEKFIAPLFAGTPYTMTACLDFVETSEPYRCTPHNLGVVLHNLSPRPRALVIGIAVDPSLVDDYEAVWRQYVEHVLKKEAEGSDWRRNAVVSLPRTHHVEPGTGRPSVDSGWDTEMFRQLDLVFQPDAANK